MIFAAIPWLSISINLLLVVFVIVCLLMTLLILMQRPKQEGLGAAFGANVTDQVFGARTTNVLQRGTVYLGSLFFIISLTLAVLVGHRNKKDSLLKDQIEKTEAVAKAAEVPVVPTPPPSLAEDLVPAPDITGTAVDSTPDATPGEEIPAPPVEGEPAPPVEGDPAPPVEEETPPVEETPPDAEPAPPVTDEAPEPSDAPTEGEPAPDEPSE